MTALKVILIVLLVLWLISLIRVGGIAEYSEEGLIVRLRVWLFRITLFPMKPRAEKPEKPKKEKKKKEKPPKEGEKPKEKTGGLLSLIMDFIPLAANAAGTLLHKIRIDELILHLTWAAEDAAAAAMGYGAGYAALGTLWPLLDNNFNVKKRDIGVAVDFTRTQPIIYARASLSLTIGQGVAFGVVYGVKALAILLRHRKPRKKKEPAVPASQ